KDGATLGALWLNSEWHRFRLLPPAQGQPQGSLDRENPAGAAVSAAVWLSISPTIGSGKGSITANVSQILDLPGKFRKVPMAFVYGEGDSKSGDVAKAAEKYIVGKNSKDYLTKAIMISGAEKMSGKDLLLDSLDTTAKIVEFLDAAVGSRKAPKTPFVAD